MEDSGILHCSPNRVANYSGNSLSMSATSSFRLKRRPALRIGVPLQNSLRNAVLSFQPVHSPAPQDRGLGVQKVLEKTGRNEGL